MSPELNAALVVLVVALGHILHGWWQSYKLEKVAEIVAENLKEKAAAVAAELKAEIRNGNGKHD